MWGPDKVAKTAEAIANQIRLTDNVAALQKGQKEIADAISVLNNRITEIEANMRALKAEVTLEALKETPTVLNSVQGGFYNKLEEIAVRLAEVERDRAPDRSEKSPVISIGKSTPDQAIDGHS